MRNKTIPYAFIILILLSVEFFFCPFSCIEGSTNVGGPIVGDITWKLAGSPYIAIAPVLILEGATLTIEPGVTVMKWMKMGTM
ncbi:MAG: hypothetical protein ACMUHX_05860 [bacterium]